MLVLCLLFVTTPSLPNACADHQTLDECYAATSSDCYWDHSVTVGACKHAGSLTSVGCPSKNFGSCTADSTCIWLSNACVAFSDFRPLTCAEITREEVCWDDLQCYWDRRISGCEFLPVTNNEPTVTDTSGMTGEHDDTAGATSTTTTTAKPTPERPCMAPSSSQCQEDPKCHWAHGQCALIHRICGLLSPVQCSLNDDCFLAGQLCVAENAQCHMLREAQSCMAFQEECIWESASATCLPSEGISCVFFQAKDTCILSDDCVWNTLTYACQGEKPGMDYGAGRFCHLFRTEPACTVQSRACNWDITTSACTPATNLQAKRLSLPQTSEAATPCTIGTNANWFWAGAIAGSIITALSVTLYFDQCKKKNQVEDISLDEVLISSFQ